MVRDLVVFTVIATFLLVEKSIPLNRQHHYCVTSVTYLLFFSMIPSVHFSQEEMYKPRVFLVGNAGNYHTAEATSKDQAVKIQPIAVPSIPVDELKEVTSNFSTDSLIGEGSYGRVYYGTLTNGRAAAIKKLDASKQPDDEFLAQVLLKIITNSCARKKVFDI